MFGEGLGKIIDYRLKKGIQMEMNKNKDMKSYLLTDEEAKLIAKYRAVKDDDVKFSINLFLDVANTAEQSGNTTIEKKYKGEKQ